FVPSTPSSPLFPYTTLFLSFTGAQGKRVGRIEHANGGSLFLDEIESMPLAQQVKLLRVIQEQSLERLGSNRSIRVDLRVISAAKDRKSTRLNSSHVNISYAV